MVRWNQLAKLPIIRCNSMTTSRQTQASPRPVAACVRCCACGHGLRLWPWVKPYLPQLTTMFVAALIATLAGLALPLLTKDVVDGPIADGDRTGLWWIGLIALGFGLVEASAAWVDLHRRLRPARLERRRPTQRHRHGHPGKFPLLGIGRGQPRDRPTRGIPRRDHRCGESRCRARVYYAATGWL